MTVLNIKLPIFTSTFRHGSFTPPRGTLYMSPRRTCIAGPPHKVVSMDTRRRFLSILGAARTMDILEYLHEHGAVQHREFNRYMNVCTLNTRLRQLLKFKIIEHHFEKKPKKKEWYTITEKGEKVLQYLKELTELIED